ncbi:ABC transporter ATP-binding protein [Pseudoxanthomonas broegbernensis]|uniref:ABC transporter ATP-binding protein n=1 Tax=Pseudoxanthomonas broegbernensis TaxID=83619 RepID=A0A7V8GMQ6_9GAMM|nr:ABC transporter permease [Pseudoxanthomonas broegbernensis]KAF1686661.1 ABC transporter ATP-binding protein [Pseudoxanthomonas broegbernensis]MBB6063580.1 putative ABC transport system permease protein [Pseudoxanthomonas broegbernensis]
MFAYYCNLALRSFRRDKALTVLMVLAIALGIGACMTTLTVFHVLSGDPMPGKSDRLFYVQLDPAEMNDYTPGEEPALQVTRHDAEALLREKRGDRQAMMTGGGVSITPDRDGMAPFMRSARYTSADFFAMFDAPMLHGRGWNAKEDEDHARVVVISSALNNRVFGDGDSTGKQLRIDRTDFTVVGVIDEWRPTPRFYDMNSDRYGELEDVFLPFTTSRDLKMSRSGSMDCWGDSGGDSTGPNAPCVWIQYWVELDSPAKAAAYRDYLVDYSDQQRAAGRYKRPTNVRLRDVMEWLAFAKVVPGDVVMQLWLGMGFLLVCLVNTVGLLLAKFLRRGSEIGVRRALGASRGAIFAQCLVEAGTVGLAGGILGLGLSLLGLWAVRQQPASYAGLARLDLGMLLLTFALAIAASVLAGLLPAWRAMQVAPAIQLKSQ